ncbi:hypothetical protein G7Y79_00018g045550 [Physcia stellaris]|nr:hypothetical protein G7Y79_00018g045550 [Physcia stellaris]
MILLLSLQASSRIQQQPTPRKATRGNDGLSFPTPLLATNHQTRDEGLAILFSKNVLGIDLIPGDVSLPPWIKHPSHLSCLRNVDLHLFPRKCSRFTLNETTIPLVAQSLQSCQNLESVKLTLFHNSETYFHNAGYYKLDSVAHIHSIAAYFGGVGARMEIWLCDTARNEGDEIWSSWNRARAPLESAPMVKMAEKATARWVYEVEGC